MATSDEERIQKLEDQVVKLTEQVSELNKEMDGLERKSSGVNKRLGDSKNLLRDAGLAIKNITVEFGKFATDTQAQYEYAEKLAESSKSTAVSMGLSAGRSKEFTKVFNEGYASLARFGMTAGDVSNIMEEYSEKSGRARIINKEEVTNIGLLSKGLGVGTQNAAELYERMELMGVGAKNAAKEINSMVIDSQKLGLNASQVAKTLSNNFDSMSRMSFKNGVNGMTKMAQLAVKMRMDVSDMLNMAEKFYEPEAAIEAAAQLQLLGGDIAEAFGDPFETMYLARNKPEELAEKVYEMTENMMQFNEETGEYEFPAEARMQLKAAGNQLGVNVDKMIDMARHAAKIKDIKMNVSGNILDEDMREGLASMARMNEDGNFVVDFKGEELDIGDIGMDKAAEILSAPKDADDAVMIMAENSMTTNEILSSVLESMKASLVAESNVYMLLEDVLRPGMSELIKGSSESVDRQLEYLETTEFGKYRENILKQAEDMGLSTAEGIKKIFEMGLGDAVKEGLKDYLKDVDDILNTMLEQFDPGQNQNNNPGQYPQTDYLSRENGQLVSFTTEDDVMGAKEGGPIDKLLDKSIGGSNNTTPSKIEVSFQPLSGRIELISPDGSMNKMEIKTILPNLEALIRSHLNGSKSPGGGNTTSSKQAVDNIGVMSD